MHREISIPLEFAPKLSMIKYETVVQNNYREKKRKSIDICRNYLPTSTGHAAKVESTGGAG